MTICFTSNSWWYENQCPLEASLNKATFPFALDVSFYRCHILSIICHSYHQIDMRLGLVDLLLSVGWKLPTVKSKKLCNDRGAPALGASDPGRPWRHLSSWSRTLQNLPVRDGDRDRKRADLITGTILTSFIHSSASDFVRLRRGVWLIQILSIEYWMCAKSQYLLMFIEPTFEGVDGRCFYNLVWQCVSGARNHIVCLFVVLCPSNI